ncbi:MAG: MG2 domain-containing protein, partial [Bacteroidota bacterium]
MRHLLLALLLAFTTGLMSQNYQADYKKIEAALKDGKPRTALEAAEAFYQKADRAGDYDEVVKAMAYRAAFISQVEEDGQAAMISLLRDELRSAKDEGVVTPLFHYMLGSIYYQFAQRNSWRLRNNTAVVEGEEEPQDKPLEDWNLTELKEAADEHLYRALELAETNRTELSSIPAVVSGDPKRFNVRPTLYDLLARECFEILGSPLLTVSDPKVSQPAQFLGNAASFVQVPLTMDPESGTYRKLKLLQQLTNFHLGPATPATLEVDVLRLNYVRRLGVADTTYAKALRQLYTTYANVPGGGILQVMEAEVYYSGSAEALGDQPKAQAMRLLEAITDKTALVANRKEQLRRRIVAKSLDVNVQTVYGLEDNLLFNVTYRNTERVYHRLYAAPLERASNDFSQWNLNEEALRQLLKKRPLGKANFKLPVNDDYETHRTETWHTSLAAGRYYLVTSDNKDFDQQNGRVSVTSFQVSNLAVLRYTDDDEYYFEVADRTTGAARAGIQVELQRANNRRETFRTFKTVTTDAEGRFANPNIDRSQLRMILRDRANDDVFVTNPAYFNTYRNQRPREYELTPLFTDRAIYRPGQTVKVYGLTWLKNRDEMPEMITREERTLTLLDPNYQNVGTVAVTSDEYSRFNAEFTLPPGGLTGIFQIQ